LYHQEIEVEGVEMRDFGR